MIAYNFSDPRTLRQAQNRIKDYIHLTPLLSSKTINAICGCDIQFKCENLQKAGAFKSRGASNAVFSLLETGYVGSVATHSSGNHAQALSRVAAFAGIKAHVVMPENALQSKIDATREYGAEITFCEPTLLARETTLTEVRKHSGAVEIHPYDNPFIIAGQATCAMEVLDAYHPDCIVAPVGGGGLLSGTALAAAHFASNVKVFGAEPTGAADAHQSFYSKQFTLSVQPKTIADGLLTSLGEYTFPLILKHVEGILLADDSDTIDSMRMLWERAKILAEPSSAVALAVVRKNPDIFAGKKVCIIISGGNADLDHLPWK